jgi:hypothetical protein
MTKKVREAGILRTDESYCKNVNITPIVRECIFEFDRYLWNNCGGEMFQNLMTEVDTDKSGSVTQDEINAFRAANVSAADTTKDGAQPRRIWRGL